MITCTKEYRDIPIAHRQHRHDGHCAWIHGHNWSFRLTFACREPDPCGFVVDFGKLKFLKQWIDGHLDHACLVNRGDPELPRLRALNRPDGPILIKLLEVPDCSSEGLALWLHSQWDALVREATQGRAWIAAIEVLEDSRNCATYRVDG